MKVDRELEITLSIILWRRLSSQFYPLVLYAYHLSSLKRLWSCWHNSKFHWENY